MHASVRAPIQAPSPCSCPFPSCCTGDLPFAPPVACGAEHVDLRYYVPVPLEALSRSAATAPRPLPQSPSPGITADLVIDLWLSVRHYLEAVHLCLLWGCHDRVPAILRAVTAQFPPDSAGDTITRSPFHRRGGRARPRTAARPTSQDAYCKTGLLDLPDEGQLFRSYRRCRWASSAAGAGDNPGPVCLHCLHELFRYFALQGLQNSDVAAVTRVLAYTELCPLSSLTLRRIVASQYVVMLRYALATLPPLLLRAPAAGAGAGEDDFALELRRALQDLVAVQSPVSRQPSPCVGGPPHRDSSALDKTLQPCKTLADFIHAYATSLGVVPAAPAPRTGSAPASAEPPEPSARGSSRESRLEASVEEGLSHVQGLIVGLLRAAMAYVTPGDPSGAAPPSYVLIRTLHDLYRQQFGARAGAAAPAPLPADDSARLTPLVREFRLLCKYVWQVYVRQKVDAYLLNADAGPRLPPDAGSGPSAGPGPRTNVYLHRGPGAESAGRAESSEGSHSDSGSTSGQDEVLLGPTSDRNNKCNEKRWYSTTPKQASPIAWALESCSIALSQGCP